MIAGDRLPCYPRAMVTAAAHLWLIIRALARPGGV